MMRRSRSCSSISSSEPKKRRVEHSKEETTSLVVLVTRNLLLNEYVVCLMDELTVSNGRTVEMVLGADSVWKIGGKDLPGTHGSYALSTIIAPEEDPTCRTFNDTPPHFECLDTSLDDPAWVHLPSPDLPPSLKPHLIQSWAVIHDSIILISVEDGATYGFDVTCGRGGGWELLNDNPLPFIGFAFCAPSSTCDGDGDIHYGYSDKTRQLCAYRFDVNDSGSFEVPVVIPPEDPSLPTLFDADPPYLAPLLGDPNKMYIVEVGFNHPLPTCYHCFPNHNSRRIVHARLMELPTTLCDDAVYLKPIGKTTRFRHRVMDAISTDIFVMSS